MDSVQIVIRIKFRSGAVSEERGTVEDIEALFDRDDDRLIDYVMGLDVLLNEFAVWMHEDDPNWSAEAIDQLFE